MDSEISDQIAVSIGNLSTNGSAEIVAVTDQLVAELSSAACPKLASSLCTDEAVDFTDSPAVLSVDELIRIMRKAGARYQQFKTYFVDAAPYIRELRRRYKNGQPLPVQGNPTWGKFVRETFGVTDRYMRMLLRREEGPSHKASKPKPSSPSTGNALGKHVATRYGVLLDQVFQHVEGEQFADAFEEFVIAILARYPTKNIGVSVESLEEEDDEELSENGAELSDADAA